MLWCLTVLWCKPVMDGGVGYTAERPKGAKNEVKQARSAQSRTKGFKQLVEVRSQRAPRFLVYTSHKMYGLAAMLC